MTSQTQFGERNIVNDAKILRALHVRGAPLLLANVWDPSTARIVESVGMRAVATSSAAVAPVHGFEDHGRLPPDVAFEALRRIASAVRIPVTADLEDGYGLSAEELVRRIAEAGVSGFNIEDTNNSAGIIVDADEQAERIAQIRAVSRNRQLDVVINARIDVHIHGRSVEDGIKRAEKYFGAGADCVYPIFESDISAIREYVAVGPTNVLCRPGGVSLPELVDAGVSRVSVGPLLFQQLLTRLKVAASALLRLDDHALWT